MNHEEIDRQLIELLRTPVQERTPGKIESAITLISTAAELETTPATQSQQEQVKLLAIANLLACDLKTTYHHASLDLYSTAETSRQLSICMRLPNGNYLIGFGETAQETLINMKEIPPKKAEAA